MPAENAAAALEVMSRYAVDQGREYLRIIYGPGYTEPGRLAAPLWRRHELVFAILACESEPVDPRL